MALAKELENSGQTTYKKNARVTRNARKKVPQAVLRKYLLNFTDNPPKALKEEYP